MTQSIIKPTKKDHTIAKLAAIAIVLSVIEFFLPSPIPGIKPGIANIIILYTLVRFDFSTAAWVSLVRIFVSSIIVGSFLSPTFFLSLFGAIVSLVLLYAVQKLPKPYFSIVSLSLIASFGHIVGQFIIARLWIIPHDSIFNLLPLFLISALIFGLFSAFVCNILLKHKLKKHTF
jgi:heptaprenyl diphosphate synthase